MDPGAIATLVPAQRPEPFHTGAWMKTPSAGPQLLVCAYHSTLHFTFLLVLCYIALFECRLGLQVLFMQILPWTVGNPLLSNPKDSVQLRVCAAVRENCG